MPYEKNTELPDGVQNVLPAHAQSIYREAYNSAFDHYSSPSERDGDDSREEVRAQGRLVCRQADIPEGRRRYVAQEIRSRHD